MKYHAATQHIRVETVSKWRKLKVNCMRETQPTHITGHCNESIAAARDCIVFVQKASLCILATRSADAAGAPFCVLQARAGNVAKVMTKLARTEQFA